MTASDEETFPVVVDLMGADHAPREIVRGLALARQDGVPIVAVGDSAECCQGLSDAPWISFVHADAVAPAAARAADVRRMTNCSIRVAMRLVRDGVGRSVVSFGNSGATLVAGVMELGTVTGVARPAIAVLVPSASEQPLILVDAGASVDCRADHLETFAGLGEAYARVLGTRTPRVGLLSNGHEEGKGNRLMREAAPLLAARCEHFVGNVEPERALAGACDVLVTDGFTGNVFLKTAEGIFDVVRRHVKDEVARSWRARWGSWLMQPVFEPLRRELDWRHRGGALLLGVGAPVVVGHGRSDAEAVRAAVRLAHYSSKARLTDQVTQAFRGPDGAP